MKNLSKFCRDFRKEVLKLTLKEVEEITFIKVKTLSAFENGRSTNINHLNIYLLLCDSKEKQDIFIKGFNNALLESNNGDYI